MSMKQICLNGAWKLYFYEEGKFNITDPVQLKTLLVPSINCTVPGNVELDLAEAGYLPKDLFMGENIVLAEQFETYEWWYEKSFEFNGANDDEEVALHFGGVDCYSEYFLNGEKIGWSDNMLIPVDINTCGKLNRGTNILYVKIRSALLTEAENSNVDVNLIVPSWRKNTLSAFARKAPHSYGWDIMPRAISAGIWREAELQIRSPFEFKQAFFMTTSIGQKRANLCFAYEFKIPKTKLKRDLVVEVSGRCGESGFYKKEKINYFAGKIDFCVDNPQLWWPYGYGDANLYNTTVKLFCDGELACEESVKLGVRTVELDRTDSTDGKNGRFHFIVNGVEIMCKGSNWVPLDAYHSRDKERYEKALALVSDIGCNILRCWGGNVYEEPTFFDYCDSHGIMVWQDFAMACRPYPQDNMFCEQLRKEAETIVRLHRNHPCIILWAGDNECDQMFAFAKTDPNTNKLTREILAEVVRLNDCRPYLPSSPYISKELFELNDLGLSPEDHLWGPRDYFKSEFYTKSKAHFVSEIGYHGCPSKKSIEKFIEKDHVWPYHNNSQWILHSSDQGGWDGRVMLMEKQIKQLFGVVPDNLDDYAFASQASQGEAKKFFIERMRMGRPEKSGVIWWNLLDGWPQMSDAVVDYYFEKKIAYDYIKRCQAPFAVMIGEMNNWALDVVAANDTLTPVSGSVTVKDVDTDELLFETEFFVAENRVIKLGRINMMYSDKKMLLIEWNAGGKVGKNHYLSGMPGFDLADYKRWYGIISNH